MLATSDSGPIEEKTRENKVLYFFFHQTDYIYRIIHWVCFKDRVRHKAIHDLQSNDIGYF